MRLWERYTAIDAKLAGLITLHSMGAQKKKQSNKAIVIPAYGVIKEDIIVIEEWDEDDDNDDYDIDEQDLQDEDDGNEEYDYFVEEMGAEEVYVADVGAAGACLLIIHIIIILLVLIFLVIH